jgi:alkaline phosphatase D
MKGFFFLVMCSIFGTTTTAQQSKLVSGPWAGNVGLRTATIWAEVDPTAKKVSVKYEAQKIGSAEKIELCKTALGNDFNPVKIALNGLEFNTTYIYKLFIDDKEVVTNFPTKFITQDLWQYRKPAPDFSFLAGSCAYMNEPIYDRPGKPYGGDSSIFETMANTAGAFHIWMGDNWYTREVDFESAWGMNYRPSHERAHKVLQKFMAAMPQYSIWDDHDYGPNDAGKYFMYKKESREIFKNYSLNPSYGEDEKGIYTKLSYSDVDFILTDDRYFRSHDQMPDSVNGKPTADKSFFGKEQMEWIKNNLLFSNATFKIIVVGSQVMNPLNKYERMNSYTYEYNELIQFIKTQKINGVVFFSGDRHHSEVIKVEDPNFYPLYDVTISPYTAGVSKVSGAEKNSTYRVAGTLVEAQNFGKITVSGAKNKRQLKVDFIGLKGEVLGSWAVGEDEIRVR